MDECEVPDPDCTWPALPKSELLPDEPLVWVDELSTDDVADSSSELAAVEEAEFSPSITPVIAPAATVAPARMPATVRRAF